MSPYLSNNPAQGTGGHCSTTRAVFPTIDADPKSLPKSVDPFTVTFENGYLPLQTPQATLPVVFGPLTLLCEEMPIVKGNRQPGLLAHYQLGPTIDEREMLPDLTGEIDKLVTADGKPDLVAITAIFRDYSFLASAYLLEPCWERQSKGLEGYGLGRAKLPACLAGPLVKTANILEIPPFMSYAASYALFNWRFVDPDIGFSEYTNLRLVRGFEHGLNPCSSEAGFILTHVDMVRHTGGLVQGVAQILDAVAAKTGSAAVADSFELLLSTMQVIELSMEKMWSHSKPRDYLRYRTFIFGIQNQSMFPDGVVYEGVNDNKPMFFRGESGANDSIIPLLDHLLQIPMPQNPLTEILKDFREYRPRPHRKFLAYVRKRAEEIGVKQYCLQELETRILYLRLLEHVRSFRWRHWMFAREYIIKGSKHPTATGGSPIVSWLPNQLFAVMELMQEVWEGISDDDRQAQGRRMNEMMAKVYGCSEDLQQEVRRWCQERDEASWKA